LAAVNVEPGWGFGGSEAVVEDHRLEVVVTAYGCVAAHCEPLEGSEVVPNLGRADSVVMADKIGAVDDEEEI
jgi:hypothetical protein